MRPAPVFRKAVLVLAAMLSAAAACAITAPNLQSRIVIDGSTSDWQADECVFGTNADGSPQEASNDSKLGPNLDIHQIRVTWDRANLYIAGEGIIWGNNMVIAIDASPALGLTSMGTLNSWRRNVTYPAGQFEPEVFCATWDGNTSPRLELLTPANSVDDRVAGPTFTAAATFLQGESGHAMEFRIPWTTVFAYSGGVVRRDTVLAGVPDSLFFLPPFTAIRIAGFVTGGADGTGGPDVAPNNALGCSMDLNATLSVDNFATIIVDQDGDGLPDMGVSPSSRVVFHDSSVPTRRETWGQLKARYH